MTKFTPAFYLQEDVCNIARNLLGCSVFSQIDGSPVSGGIIVETEAYAGITDQASHAYNNRRTPRTEIMFHSGGVAYVYLCYGMHSLLNVVTNREGIPHAILIRAIEPTAGTATMLIRKNKKEITPALTAGPAMLTQALGVTTTHSGEDLRGSRIWIEKSARRIPSNKILSTPRIGVDYAGADAKLPWRFRIRNNQWTSKAK
ncbi:DNA-3-methyladenine glycosylase [PVC group bacterium]|nr:DNA-3-methyladenine glycosylase [PVC group bacterium]